MKTAIIFNEFEGGLSYLIADIDLAEYNDIYINQYYDNVDDEKLSDELHEILFDDFSGLVIPKVTLDEFVAFIRNNDCNVIECGFI